MSKYDPLRKRIAENRSGDFSLSFEEIEQITGFPLDHSFLNCRKELTQYGWQVGKISLKRRSMEFIRQKGPCMNDDGPEPTDRLTKGPKA